MKRSTASSDAFVRFLSCVFKIPASDLKCDGFLDTNARRRELLLDIAISGLHFPISVSLLLAGL